MKIIEKKKIYKGMAELKDYEIERFVKFGEKVKIIYDNKFMILTPYQLQKNKIFINTQKSIIHDGQTYAIYGYRWKPTGTLEEQIGIDYSGLAKFTDGNKAWKELGEKLHS